MSPEAHRRALQESIETLHECVQTGIEKRQRTIGFHCSAAGADLLELYLHSMDAINPGVVVKHDFFASERKANEKLAVDFPEKTALFSFLTQIEAKRNVLCYGKPQPRETIEETLELFASLRKLLETKGVKV